MNRPIDMQLEDAVEAGDVERVEVLLREGVDPNVLCHGLETAALEVAVKREDAEMVGLFARAGADVERPDSDGRTLSSQAASSRDGSVSLLVLLGVGANPNEPDRAGWTPLHWAAVHGYEANVKALLDHGANPDATNKDGSNPQAAAERNQHWNVAQMLARTPPLRSPNTSDNALITG